MDADDRRARRERWAVSGGSDRGGAGPGPAPDRGRTAAGAVRPAARTCGVPEVGPTSSPAMIGLAQRPSKIVGRVATPALPDLQPGPQPAVAAGDAPRRPRTSS